MPDTTNKCLICCEPTRSLKNNFCSRKCFLEDLKTSPQQGKMTQKENYSIENCTQCKRVILCYLGKKSFCGNACYKRFMRSDSLNYLKLRNEEFQCRSLVKKLQKYKGKN
jgi:hypothetical protein